MEYRYGFVPLDGYSRREAFPPNQSYKLSSKFDGVIFNGEEEEQQQQQKTQTKKISQFTQKPLSVVKH